MVWDLEPSKQLSLSFTALVAKRLPSTQRRNSAFCQVSSRTVLAAAGEVLPDQIQETYSRRGSSVFSGGIHPKELTPSGLLGLLGL